MVVHGKALLQISFQAYVNPSASKLLLGTVQEASNYVDCELHRRLTEINKLLDEYPQRRIANTYIHSCLRKTGPDS